ncbi:hypothetical protein [Cryobacterium cryoconiti]|uniref:HK97 gp10 family phage protein n=1 Tax=Cryobacterium cryoconiti TaxID=1259239 RepID=A0A4Y8JSM4_9MICO|nr:hypothetical protein [Cryobacterium cryoconiti]TFD27520.1 hypothetical protein E3T49_13340 [Cryobacterium cryoconiti]
MADFDFSEFDRLAADLAEVPKNTGPWINSAIHVTSQKVRKSWQDKLRGSRSLPGLPSAVTYDITTFQGFGASVIQSEIGFDKARRQGPLGVFSEYGSINNPPRGFGLAALQENQDDFQEGLARAVDDALKESGL